MPDVAANPQNTAEVACALVAAGLDVQSLQDCIELISAEYVTLPDGHRWQMKTPLDAAWRLRGLASLLPSGHSSIQMAVDGLAELCREGLWSLDGASGSSPSVFATAVAVEALGAARKTAPVETTKALSFLKDYLAREGWRDDSCPLSHTAWAILALIRAEHGTGLPKRLDGPLRKGIEMLFKEVGRGPEVEEEDVLRGGRADTWRHNTSNLVLTALLAAQPEAALAPAMRLATRSALNCQDMRGHNAGAFRTGAGGIFTTYATAQGIELLLAYKRAVREVCPADAVEALLRPDGGHHTDPQSIFVPLGHVRFMANSSAMFVWAATSTLSTGALMGMLIYGGTLIPLLRKVGVVFSLYALAFGWYGYICARFPRLSNWKIATVLYGLMTALWIPLVMYFFPA